MDKEYLWIRLGDRSGYEKEGSVKDLAESFVQDYGITKKLIRYGRYGVTDKDKFNGTNYISLYYGDDEGQPTRPITKKELAELNEGIKNGTKSNC